MADVAGVWPQTRQDLLRAVCVWLEQCDDRQSSWLLKTVRDGLIEIGSPESSLIETLDRAVPEIESALEPMQAHQRQLALLKVRAAASILSMVE